VSLTAPVSVIIPTLNEVDNIETVVERVYAVTSAFGVEIIVVDDGSKDGTQERVRALEAKYPVHLLARANPEQGLCGAIVAGAKLAKYEIVVVLDADLSHPPERIPDLVNPVRENQRDMVIGSRYVPGGQTPGWPLSRKLMSYGASVCARPLTSARDSLSGFFATRTRYVTDLAQGFAGFKIALEILVTTNERLRVGEIPIVFVDRTRGASKMNTRVIFTYFRRLFDLFWIVHRRRRRMLATLPRPVDGARK